MAGIGWKLERMMDHGSLTSTVAAYLTGVAVTSAPWLLTTAALVSIRLLTREQAGVGEFPVVERIVTAFDRDQPDGPFHVGVRHAQDALGRSNAADTELLRDGTDSRSRAGCIQMHLAADQLVPWRRNIRIRGRATRGVAAGERQHGSRMPKIATSS